MTTFPTLKTGAFAQYPTVRRDIFRNVVLRFLDGSEQKYRNAGRTTRAWTLRLNLLDESELATFEHFFEGQQGQAQTFNFVDPWDGLAYTCRFSDSSLEAALNGDHRNNTEVTVIEVLGS